VEVETQPTRARLAIRAVTTWRYISECKPLQKSELLLLGGQLRSAR
jgi:hypothetical protein